MMNKSDLLHQIDTFLLDCPPEPDGSTFKTALRNAVGIAQGEPDGWRETIGDALVAAKATAPSASARSAVRAFQDALSAIE